MRDRWQGYGGRCAKFGHLSPEGRGQETMAWVTAFRRLHGGLPRGAQRQVKIAPAKLIDIRCDGGYQAGSLGIQQQPQSAGKRHIHRRGNLACLAVVKDRDGSWPFAQAKGPAVRRRPDRRNPATGASCWGTEPAPHKRPHVGQPDSPSAPTPSSTATAAGTITRDANAGKMSNSPI